MSLLQYVEVTSGLDRVDSASSNTIAAMSASAEFDFKGTNRVPAEYVLKVGDQYTAKVFD